MATGSEPFGTPRWVVAWLLPRAVGIQRALSFALSGEPLTPDAAVAWGLVTEVSTDAPARGRSLAAALASGPAGAISPQVATPETQSLIAQFLARSAAPAATVTTH